MNPLDNIKVVLVGTLYTGNVGSACRAMANMGFRHLVLAAPNLQNSWDEGERMAWARGKLPTMNNSWRKRPEAFNHADQSSLYV